MEILDALRKFYGQKIALEELEPNIMRIYAPFFHEDGDMLSMYLQISPDGKLQIRDFGNTLMRLSYTFDVDTENRRSILSSIVESNYGNLDDGELLLDTDLDHLGQSIFQYSQIVAKVSNMDILRRETVRSMFNVYLAEYIDQELKKYYIQRNVAPTNDKQLVVDFQIGKEKPFYLFGVNENTKASKVVITCLTFQKQRIPFRSLIVHEDFNALSAFNRNQITNAADKQYTSLEDFKTEGIDYIERQIAS